MLGTRRERHDWSAKPPGRRLALSIGFVALAATGLLFDGTRDYKRVLALVVAPVLIVVFAVRGARAAGSFAPESRP
jgi:hypothetical protein